MDEHTYFISEVSRLVGVEPHVLRYWEEELGLEISRNSQGKRCYFEGDVELFREVKRWKDKGMQLKAVKEMMNAGKGILGAEKEQEAEPEPEFSVVTVETPSDSMRKLEQLLDGIIGRALEKNNDRLVQEICDVILQRLEESLDGRLEEKAKEIMEQELMQEMLREGERESAAASQRGRRNLLQRWRKWIERHV